MPNYHQLSNDSTFENTVSVGETAVSVASFEKNLVIGRMEPSA